jgi:hypothetical protein
VKRQPWEGDHFVIEWICTFVPTRQNDAPPCGRPAEYEIDFGWEDGYQSLACAEHAVLARSEYTVKTIRSVQR